MALEPSHPRSDRRESSSAAIPEHEAGHASSSLEESESFERQLDGALARLAAGEELSLEELRGHVPPSEWACFAGTLRAEEYRFRLEREGDVALEPLLEELDAPAREHFFRVLAAARTARGVLPHRIEPGTEIRGRWLVLRRLGSGGQARVYAAWDKEFELEVALKVFDEPPLARGEPWSQAALSESRILAHLRSRNIVRVFDIVREQGLTLVVMGLVRGIRLRDALDRLRSEEASGADPRGRTARLRAAIAQEREGQHVDLLEGGSWYRAVARLALVMARTLEEAHQSHTAHRDLNPKNVMLVGGGEPVLLDFGLAARRRSEGPRGWTFPYVAPECLGEREVASETSADLYQLGLVLYELLTLERAFALREGESSNAVLFRVARGDFTPPRKLCPAIPEALEAICLHALATRPETRYRSAGDLARDLERFLRGLPPVTAPLRLSARVGMRARHAARSPVLIGLVALVAVALVPSVLARDSWAPPRVSVQTTSAKSGDVEEVRPGQALIRDDCFLGARIDCRTPAFLYAFRLVGDASDPGDLFLSTADCLVTGDNSRQVEEGGVRLDAGHHTVQCLNLRDAEQRNGLLLVFAPRASSILELLRSELVAREERYERLRYGALSGLLAQLSGPSRGQTLAGLDEETRLRLHAIARSGRQAQGLSDLWQALGVQEYLFVFPVLEPGEEHSHD